MGSARYGRQVLGPVILGEHTLVDMVRVVGDVERCGAGVELHDLLLAGLLLGDLLGADFDAGEVFELRLVLQEDVYDVAHREGDLDLFTVVALPVEFGGRCILRHGFGCGRCAGAAGMAHEASQGSAAKPTPTVADCLRNCLRDTDLGTI